MYPLLHEGFLYRDIASQTYEMLDIISLMGCSSLELCRAPPLTLPIPIGPSLPLLHYATNGHRSL